MNRRACCWNSELVFALTALLGLAFASPAWAVITWTGAGDGSSWADAANWSNNPVGIGNPEVDTLQFNAAPASNSVMDTAASQEVAGLTYIAGTHTLDLDGNTLEISTGGTFLVGNNATAHLTISGGTGLIAPTLLVGEGSSGNGTLVLADAANFENITNLRLGFLGNVGPGTTMGKVTVQGGTVDWNFSTLSMGVKTHTGSGSETAHGTGILDLTAATGEVKIQAGTMDLAWGSIDVADGATLSLTGTNIYIGGGSRNADFTLTPTVGGTLNIGTSGNRVSNLDVGRRTTTGSISEAKGTLQNLGRDLNVFATSLSVGFNTSTGSGPANGFVTLNSGAAMDISSTIFVGRGTTANGEMTIADSSLITGGFFTTPGTGNLHIGRKDSQPSGNTVGTFTVQGGSINWNLASLSLGWNNASGTGSGTGSGTLDFTAIASPMSIHTSGEMNLAQGAILMSPGAQLTLTSDTALRVGGAGRTGNMTLAPATGGTLNLGTSGNRLPLLEVGRHNTTADGTVTGKLENLGRNLNAFAVDLNIGYAASTVAKVANGTVELGPNAVVDVSNSVYVGRGSQSTGTLTLDSGSRLVFSGGTRALRIGLHDTANTGGNTTARGTVTVTGGTTAWNLTNLTVGQVTSNGGVAEGELDLSGTTLNNMTVANFQVGVGINNAVGDVALGAGTMTTTTLNIGSGGGGVSSFSTNDTLLTVNSSLTIGDNDNAVSVIDGISSGFTLGQNATLNIFNSAGGLELQFFDPSFSPSPQEPWWGFRWEYDAGLLPGGHVAELEALLNAGVYSGTGEITASFFGVNSGGLYADPNLLFIGNYTDNGTSYTYIGFNTAPIPEPATTWLVLTGLAGLSFQRRRRHIGKEQGSM